jgi:hypothetical protein
VEESHKGLPEDDMVPDVPLKCGDSYYLDLLRVNPLKLGE